MKRRPGRFARASKGFQHAELPKLLCCCLLIKRIKSCETCKVYIGSSLKLTCYRTLAANDTRVGRVEDTIVYERIGRALVVEREYRIHVSDLTVDLAVYVVARDKH